MAERMMTAGRLSRLGIVRSSIQKSTCCRLFQKAQIPPRCLHTRRILIIQQKTAQSGTITGTTSPVAPLEISGSKAIIPGSVLQHKIQMGPHITLRQFVYFVIAAKSAIKEETRNRFFHIISNIHRTAAPLASFGPWNAFANQKPILRRLSQGNLRQFRSFFLKLLFSQHHTALIERQCVRKRIIDVVVDNPLIGRNIFCHLEQPRFPRLLLLFLQKISVEPQSICQRRSQKYRCSRPGAADIIPVNTVLLLNRIICPFKKISGCLNPSTTFFPIISVCRFFGHPHKRIHRIHTPSVNHAAGWAENASVQPWITCSFYLKLQKTFTPLMK